MSCIRKCLLSEASPLCQRLQSQLPRFQIDVGTATVRGYNFCIKLYPHVGKLRTRLNKSQLVSLVIGLQIEHSDFKLNIFGTIATDFGANEPWYKSESALNTRTQNY